MSDYWVFFGTTLLAIVCMSVFVINFIVTGGLYYYYLGRIRRQPRKLEDLFIGFQRMTLPLILEGLVQTLIWMGIAILMYGILFIGMFLALGNEKFIIGLLVIILEVPLMFLCWYLSISWMFSFPLIIERRFKFWDAMEVSRRVAGHQFWRLLGFSIVLVLIGMLGTFCCYVGIFFVIPLNIAAFAYLYEDLFGGLSQETDRDMIEIN
jgi:uncharacterized membrane protein